MLVGCLDEIFFHRRPVLEDVEPASMVWFLGQKVDDRTEATWAKALHAWTALSYVLAAAGTGLQAGIAAVQQQRQKDDQPAWESSLDVFHTTPEARRVLRLNWNREERLREQAEAASRRVAQAQQQGLEARGVAEVARAAWTKKGTTPTRSCGQEVGKISQLENCFGWVILVACPQMPGDGAVTASQVDANGGQTTSTIHPTVLPDLPSSCPHDLV